MNKEKPPVLSDEEITEILDRHAKEGGDTNWEDVLVKAQRDADVEWWKTYWSKEQLKAIEHGTAVSRVMQDMAVQQARQETAREIIQLAIECDLLCLEDEANDVGCPTCQKFWQSFKAKCLGGSQ